MLAVVCLAFATLSLLVALGTPPWEANDEPSHASNVEILRSGHWYRISAHSAIESHQPPLYYLGLAVYADVIGLPHNRTNPVPRRTLADIVNNPGLFRHDVPQDRADSSYVRALRLPGVGLGVLTVLLTAWVAWLMSEDAWTPVVAAAICAFIPRFVFGSGVINNDNLASTLGALTTACAAYIVVRPTVDLRRNVARAAALGALVGALVLTKYSAIPLASGAAFALTISLMRNEARVWGRVALALGVFAATAIATCGWWLAHNIAWYGDLFASKAAHDQFRHLAPFLIAGVQVSLNRAFVYIPQNLWSTLWYGSGWNQFRWGTWWYLPFWLGLAVGLVGLISGRRRVFAAQQRRAVTVVGTMAIGAFVGYWIIGFQVNAPQGREVFVGLAAIATLVALGFERLRLPVWARFVFPIVGLIGTGVAIYGDVFRLYA